MPLRFTLVTTFYPPHAFGGDAIHVHELAAGLAARGHAVRVVHSSSAFRLQRGAQPLDGLGPIRGVDVIDLDIGRAQLIGTYLAGLPVGYRRSLRDACADADVVHFHNPSLMGGMGGAQIPSALRAYTAHEHWLLCPMHTLFRNESEVCTQRTCVRCCASYHRPPQPWRWTGLLPRAVDALDVVMCPSRFTADLHRASFPRAAIDVVRPSGPLQAATSGVWVAHPRPYVLFAGRLQPIKGARWLAEALSGEDDLDVVFAGDGPERAAIESVAAGARRIVLLGQRSRPDVLRLCAEAHAVIVPSLGYETFGGSGREALAVGTPIIVRDLGGLPELVEDGGGVTFSTAEELRAIVRRLATDTEWYASLRASVPRISGEADAARFFADYFGCLGRAARRARRHSLEAALEDARRAAPQAPLEDQR